MKSKEADYNKLEFEIGLASSQSKLPNLASRLGEIWNGFVELILRVDEPKIYASKNKFGDVYWTAYDPFTRGGVYLNSETELRAWLDCRNCR